MIKEKTPLCREGMLAVVGFEVRVERTCWTAGWLDSVTGGNRYGRRVLLQHISLAKCKY